MHVPLKEFSIKILSPTMAGKCIYNSSCKEAGMFSVFHISDRDKIVFVIDPCCERHVIDAMLDAFLGEE